MRSSSIIGTVALLSLLLGAAPVNSWALQVRRNVISSGATSGRSAHFRVIDLLGEPVSNQGASTSYGLGSGFVAGQGPLYVCGDASGDNKVNVADAVYIISFVFVPGSPGPHPPPAGDAGCDGKVNVADAVYIINYVFVPGSPAPCASCS